MDFLPLFTDLRNKPCLLIGGGQVALRKARLLCKAGAKLRLVAHDILPELSTLCLNAGGECIRGDYGDHLLDGVFLVIAATDDQDVNSRVSAACHSRQIPVNVVDSPDLCSVILPAIIDRSPLMIAVSSGGKSPVLARMMRSRLEASIPAAYGRLANLVGQFRDAVKTLKIDAIFGSKPCKARLLKWYLQAMKRLLPLCSVTPLKKGLWKSVARCI
jgi:uroporphyrin-III C-methyltransferase/precorrin-2 dehydrogenase/sirohydrochlorin ferrochelatase